MNVPSPGGSFQYVQKIKSRTEAAFKAADLGLVEYGADDLRKRQILPGTQKIKHFVVVDDAPASKPDLPTGLSESNRDRAQCNQESCPPTTARKCNISSLLKYKGSTH